MESPEAMSSTSAAHSLARDHFHNSCRINFAGRTAGEYQPSISNIFAIMDETYRLVCLELMCGNMKKVLVSVPMNP